MKENMEQTLKMLNQHEQNVRDTYHQNRLSLAITPVQKARIELEKAINEAAQNDSDTLARLIVGLKPEEVLEVRGYGGDMPAHIAARSNSNSLKVLINAFGQNLLRVQDNGGDTPANIAAKYNSKSLELLIERFGEKVLEVKDKLGNTALHSAAGYNRDSFKLFIDKIPQTAKSLFTEKNSAGSTPLHLAVKSKGDLLQLLIEKYPKIIESFLSEKNAAGVTPSHLAAAYNKDLLELLIDKFGEKVLEVKDNSGNTALHFAAKLNKECLELLIARFPEIIKNVLGDKNTGGDTVLHLAAEYNKESLELLIEKFPEITQSLLCEQNKVGDTVLHIVAQYHKDSLELLIDKFPAVIESLLSNQDIDGHTPLHLSTGNEGAFKLLIDNFPEQVKHLFYVENQFGKTVLQYANSECPDALPKEYRIKQSSCVILGNKDCTPIPGLPETFSSYYQDQVALLLKLRLEDAAPGALKSVNVLEANYTLRNSNADYIAAKLSSFILASDKDTILMPLNIGGSHLVGIAVVRDGNKVVIHYMDSELNLPPESLFAKIGAMLESYGYSMELRIAEVERQKYSNCGPEVIENLTAFATGTPRASQEEAILKHSTVLEKYLLKDSADSSHPDLSTSVAIFSGVSALNEKLVAQVRHYLNTGELFDSARSAIEDGTVSIILRQSAVVSDEEVPNTIPLIPIQTYNADSYHDNLEALSPTTDFSQDYTVAIVGLLCSFLVST